MIESAIVSHLILPVCRTMPVSEGNMACSVLPPIQDVIMALPRVAAANY